MKSYKTDEITDGILEILSKDSRTSPGDIARMLDIPEKDVERIVHKLEKDEIILRYRATINWQRVRQTGVRALIEVKVTPERKVGFDAVAELIYRFPEVTDVILISGGFDLLVYVAGETLQEVAFFVSEKLSTIKGIQSTQTHFMLKKYKEDGVILEGAPDLKRLPVTP